MNYITVDVFFVSKVYSRSTKYKTFLGLLPKDDVENEIMNLLRYFTIFLNFSYEVFLWVCQIISIFSLFALDWKKDVEIQMSLLQVLNIYVLPINTTFSAESDIV